MSLHTDLPIYRTGVQLLSIAVKVQEQMPRGVKRSLGDKISQHCVEMLNLMALANSTKHGERAEYIKQLMTHLRATTVLLRVSHDSKYVSHALWANSVQLLESIGKQGGKPFDSCGPRSCHKELWRLTIMAWTLKTHTANKKGQICEQLRQPWTIG